MDPASPNEQKWGIYNDYAPLRDVLLGKPEYYRWIDAGPITRRTILKADKTGATFNLQTAMQQHSEMVRLYEQADVTCHYLDSDPVLHRNFFARDSSAMGFEVFDPDMSMFTLGGGGVHCLSQALRRDDA